MQYIPSKFFKFEYGQSQTHEVSQIFPPGFGCALFCICYLFYTITVCFTNQTSFNKSFMHVLNERTKILLYQTYYQVFNMLCILFQVKPATRTKQRKIAPNPTPSPNNTYLAQLLTTGEFCWFSTIRSTLQFSCFSLAVCTEIFNLLKSNT